MDKKTMVIIAVILAAALVYWKFFHHKPMTHKAGGTAAVKKKGGGGWRHRFSHLAKGIAGNAAHLAAGSVPGGGLAGKLTAGVSL